MKGHTNVKTNRRRTQDREASPDPPDDKPGSIHTNERIGIKRSKTPEGFLLCEEVPIARTGWMMYAPGEIPIEPNSGGYIMVERDAATLFHPLTIASFNGKPVTNDHPPEGVNPTNHKLFAMGHALNVRRGTGIDDDVLLADLLITDASTIADVEAGKREVSAGYEADYETIGPGEGRQLDIFGNHIALVARGRCGPRCAIGDSDIQPEGTIDMPQERKTTTTVVPARRRVTLSDAFKQRVIDAGLEAMESAMDEPPLMNGNASGDDEGGEAGGVHIHLHQGGAPAGAPSPAVNDDGSGGVPPVVPPAGADPAAAGGDVGGRLTALETGMAKILQLLEGAGTAPAAKPVSTGDEFPDGEGTDTDDENILGAKDITPDSGAAPAGATDLTADSAALETSFKSVMADVEILSPGMLTPKFDAKALRKTTVDSMCVTRRKALDMAYSTTEGRMTVDAVAGAVKTLDLATMDCKAVAVLFKSAAGAKKLLNNRAATGDAGKVPPPPVAKKGPMTIADLNKLHAQTYTH